MRQSPTALIRRLKSYCCTISTASAAGNIGDQPPESCSQIAAADLKSFQAAARPSPYFLGPKRAARRKSAGEEGG